jgi:hypothetical protein
MFDGLHIPMWKRTKNPLAIALNGAGRGWGGELMGIMWLMYNISIIGIVTMNSPHVMNIS